MSEQTEIDKVVLDRLDRARLFLEEIRGSWPVVDALDLVQEAMYIIKSSAKEPEA